ncbi:hypothetical protein ScFU149_02700 [Streptococcus canis]|nr:hypothetical protein ScFU149_02700 [Streptococcus canis]
MSRKGKTYMSKKTKGIIAGAAALTLVLIGGMLWKQQQDSLSTSATKEPYLAVNVTEGSIASSTLLSGTVKALSEEYIYFDASKGADATVTVKVGDQVTQG